MPIRVNLKEIFPSDPQEINVEKLNFNFNKLLELGVGSPGPIGLTGPQGPAGPIGLVGPQGDRGATWWVDAGDPNTITFSEPLMDGDMYLDQTSNVFQIYQYDALTSTWNTVVSIAAVVNAYLSTASPSPFEISQINVPLPSSLSVSDQFVVFKNRSNTSLDVARGVSNVSNNNILFLNNFDETLITEPNINSYPGFGQNQYNSLLGIFAAHNDGQLSVNAEVGRYHIELGSVYNNGTTSIFSELKHNLKGKFYKRYLTSPELAATNEWINTAKFSLSVPEPFIAPDVDQNGEFEFVVPKYNNEGTPVNEEVYIRLGSAEAFEEHTNKAVILADGIAITNDQVGRSMVVGLREDLGAVLNLPYSTSNFALFDVSDDVDGLFFNKTLIQTGGNFEQIHTLPVFLNNKSSAITSSGNDNKNYTSIFSNGDILIYTQAGDNSVLTQDTDSSGSIAIYQFNSNLDKSFIYADTNPSNYLADSPAYDNHGHPIYDKFDPKYFPLTNVTSVDFVGKYMYLTRIKPQDVLYTYPQVSILDTFIISELDSNGYGGLAIGMTGESDPELHSLTKVKVIGNTAYLLRKRLTTSDWTQTTSALISMDVTDPTAPTTLDIAASSNKETYFDVDFYGERAYIIKHRDLTGFLPTHLSIRRIDISNPSSLVQATDTTIITGNSSSLDTATIKVDGDRIYVTHKSKLYVYSNTEKNSIALSAIISGGFEIDPNLTITDHIINGRYLYALGEDSSTGYGSIVTIDISDISSPLIVATESNLKITAPGKMVLVGNKIFVSTSNGTGGLSSELPGLSEYEIDGIVSPAANVSSVQSSNIDVSNNLNVGKSLRVGRSVNVGAGGIVTDGVIVGTSVNAISHTAIKVTNNAVDQVITSNLVTTYTAQFSTIEYDNLEEFDNSTYKFTAKESGYYQFNFHGALKNVASSYIAIIGSVLLYDSNSNETRLSIIYNGAGTSESLSEYVLDGSRPDMSGSAIIYVAAGDWVQVKYNCYALDQTSTPINMSMYLQELTINKIV